MKRLILSLLLCATVVATAQPPGALERFAGSPFSLEAQAKFINIPPRAKVADIGSGDLLKILLLASYFPDASFTLEDISDKDCNWRTFEKVVRKKGLPLKKENFTIAIGNDSSTMLPSAHFDFVILQSVVHEFSKKQEMLSDVKRILKPGGVIFIRESLECIDYKPTKSKGLCFTQGCDYMGEDSFYDLLERMEMEITDQKVFWEDTFISGVLLKCRPR